MRRLILCLAVIAPLAAAAQSPGLAPGPAPGPAPEPAPVTKSELELAYLLVSGKAETQQPGLPNMTIQISEGTTTGSAEILKAGHCRYEVKRDLVIKMSADEVLYYRDRAQYDFSKSVKAQIKTAEGGGHEVTFTGSTGIVSLVKNLYFVKKGVREDDATQSETEEDWDLDLKSAGISAENYKTAGQEFASRFCAGFQAAGP